MHAASSSTGQDRARPCAGRPRPVDRRVRRAAPQPGTARADGRGRDPRLSGRPRLGRAAERSDGTGPRAVVPAGISRGLRPRRRRRHPLPASHAVGRRSERRVRRGIPAGLDRDRPPPGVQDRHRRVHRRADGAVRVPRLPRTTTALREFYTTTATRDIFAIGSLLFSLLRGDSLADTGPLASLIARHVDAGSCDKSPHAHRAGRRLYVGTVDLDAQQFVVWNMGAIAVNGQPDALELFRKVVLASASIPIAFPPVFFDVEAGGRRYDEMHVDGSVAAHVFLSGGGVPAVPHPRARGARPGARGHLRDPQRPAAGRPEADAAFAAWHRAARVWRRRDGWRWSAISSASTPLRCASRGVPVGHDPAGRRSLRRGGVRPGDDARALRDRLQASARRTGLGRRSAGTGVAEHGALTGEVETRAATTRCRSQCGIPFSSAHPVQTIGGPRHGCCAATMTLRCVTLPSSDGSLPEAGTNAFDTGRCDSLFQP